ncbi:hypothetical protein AeMF1_013680 [Aphanomyces euteiches]|nr:hypothetical protein AeMF1_013680 [Aphanomyces euteiches]KAH9188168.1 hypothetical protein AeNC1_009851 [Aphanomyces euteiches]
MERATTPDAALLRECSLYLQAQLLSDAQVDVLHILQLICAKFRAETPPASLVSELSPIVDDLLAQENQLLNIALRHLSLRLAQDRLWMHQVMESLLPARTCLDVVLSIDAIALPKWLAPIRALIRDACGGGAYLEQQFVFVSSMIRPILNDLSQIDRDLLLPLVHKAPEVPSDTPFSLFIPTLNSSLPLFPLYVSKTLPVRIPRARIGYHPLVPLVVLSESIYDEVDGVALTSTNMPWLHLKSTELRLYLGISHYPSPSTCPSSETLLDLPLVVYYSSKSSPYPHVSLSPELPISSGSVPYLVECQRGNIPIVLSIPHGGSASVFGTWQNQHLHLRKPSHTSRKRFTMLSDARTIHVGADTSAILEANTGGLRPYLVIAKFHRKYVDVNRSIHDDAYVPKALAARMYAQYHSTLVHVLQEIWMRFPMQEHLLIDLHGQRAKSCSKLNISHIESKELIYLGTRNGMTLKSPSMMQRNFVGELHDALRVQGYRGVYPPPSMGATTPERAEFLGGCIVQTYGFQVSGVNAIQLELGTHLRGTDVEDSQVAHQQRTRTASALATAMEKHLVHSRFVMTPCKL